MNGRRGALDLLDPVGLCRGQRPGAGEVAKKQVVLPQVVQKGLPRQRPVAEPLDETVAHIGLPFRPAGVAEGGEERRAVVGPDHGALRDHWALQRLWK